MTDCRKVFLDTAPLIYLLDNDANYIQKIRLIFTELREAGIPIVSSVITCEEYLVFPFRTNNREKIAAFCEFVSDCGIVLRNIDRETAEKAARIRAEYPYFKGMDALQLASACLSGCDVMLTNDNQLKQFQEVRCITVDGWEPGFWSGGRQIED